ncbi:MAG: hypothetical protein A3J07_04740 [Candidatus Doudnabacteria bacterium RIFCSPLOWO2_02_FULL_49_13]|uniref:Type II secretion system protein GspG C-terminal domain-containing protein n=1 Tax=Candidatus Doudnabacteria bacterium RIFCSPHIGHO2_12_FULL_48_16 TaxID=1817838 RepID=A0A1F5PKM0_9BACT|nr:MAG: hypothetical protein A3B77_01540 [Candidatus Doudnabacteria bacterium RIFCSPHIGHO2_02_FULL_49_24]OGE90212.1 MAG: hypothetical protein A3E29_03880 [Candidatus Doudnabacteria bacterium RIFCSPHIGHO2_12_FULL_48_16]OGF03354.1 MAG: hypothetical protein A3J07_04740 [Candidatus Doudnabacteria bacterium RIFCSPLOWO2_02_FULL_49_13]
MTTPELLAYIESSRQSGLADSEIKQALLAQGWPVSDIDEGLTPPTAAESMAPAGPGKLSFFKSKKFLITSGAAVAVLLIAGGLVYAFWPVGPEVIMTRMFDQMDGLTSFNYEGNVTGTVNAPSLMSLVPTALTNSKTVYQPQAAGQVAGTTNSKVTLDFTGAAEVADVNNPKVEFSFTLTFQDFVFGVETKTLTKTVYIKLDQVPDLGFIDLSKIKNIWIKIDESELGQSSAGDELTPEQKRKLRELWDTSNPFSISAKLPDEKIDGAAVYRFQYQIDRERLKQFIAGSEQIATGHEMDDTEKQELLKGVTFTTGELWIGKKDYYLRKITGGVSASTESNSVGSGQVNWEFKMSNFNQPLNIQAPAEYKTVDEITALLTGQSLGDARENSRDAKRISDIRQLQTALELFYNDNARYPTALNGVVNTNDGSPKWSTYISSWPAAPEPADGGCSMEQNQYKYQGGGSDYSLTFCLGGVVGGYAAGPHTLSPAGIQ